MFIFVDVADSMKNNRRSPLHGTDLLYHLMSLRGLISWLTAATGFEKAETGSDQTM